MPFSDLRNLSSSALRGYAKYHRRSSKALHSSITELDCYSAESSLSFSVPTAVIVEPWLRKVYKCQNLCEFQCLVGPLFRSSLATACRLHDLPLVLYHESRPTNDLAYPPSSLTPPNIGLGTDHRYPAPSSRQCAEEGITIGCITPCRSTVVLPMLVSRVGRED